MPNFEMDRSLRSSNQSTVNVFSHTHRLRKTGLILLAASAGLFLLIPAGIAQNLAPLQNGSANASQSANQNGNDSVTPPPPGQPPPPPTAAEIDAAKTNPRMARLSDVEGSVQIISDGKTQFSQATMNMPVLQGSQVVTGTDGRAEIQFEDGSVARLTPNSSLTLTNLGTSPENSFSTTITQSTGLAYYELRSAPRDEYRVMVGGNAITPSANTTFRVNLGTKQPEIAVLAGSISVEGAGKSYQTEAKQGQTVQINASANNARLTVSDGIMPNGFDDWNDQLDQEAAQEAQDQTSARAQQGGDSVGYGWSDLDTYGSWYPLPGYGMVWQPYGAGLAFNPYGFGMWGYYGPFGYTWISGYPWGWLPFHCGMWSYIDSFGWGWMPGAYGCGPWGVGFGFGFGYYGWGYGGYGYAGYPYRWRHDHHGWRGRHPLTNIAHAPAGYRPPTPPAIVKGQTPARIVRVGSPAILYPTNKVGVPGRNRALTSTAKTVRFNGTKIAPLASTMKGIHVPLRNAALVNNYPARAYPAGLRETLIARQSPGRIAGGMQPARNGGSVGTLRGPVAIDRHGNMGHLQERPHEIFGSHATLQNHMTSMNHPVFAEHPVLGNRSLFGSRSAFGNHTAFGQRTSFGPRGSFGGVHSGFSGGAARMGGSHGGFGGGHSSGFSGGGHVGGFSGGGFHGGGGGGGAAHGGGGGHSH